MTMVLVAEELLKLSLLTDCSMSYYLCLERIIRVGLGWQMDQVLNFYSKLQRQATMWSSLVCWTRILQVANCISICANHTSGSAGQNGCNFRLTAEMAGDVSGMRSANRTVSLPLTPVRSSICSRQGHQCRD